VKLIERSIENTGKEMREKSFFLIFEKGWYCLSKFDWEESERNFMILALVSFDLPNFDWVLFN
jgi:hypothetical protein